MKILFFDYWLKGIANFERLVPEFQKHENIELKMIHVGSWRESQQAIVNQHRGFVSYDISYYKTHNLYKVLKREKPDILLILNLYYLMDKALIVFCKKQNIKVIALSHGRYSCDKVDNLGKYLKSDLKHNFLQKIRVDTLSILYNYLIATFLERKPFLFIQSLIRLCKDPISMTLLSVYNDELAADKILVFYESDKKILLNERCFPNKKIQVVGNPELDSYLSKDAMDKRNFMESNHIPTDYLLYLDDGLVQANIMSRENWYMLIRDLNGICNRNALKLVVKLHPRTDMNACAEFFQQEGIIGFQQNMKDLIVNSIAVTSLWSTTISLALVSEKKIISPRWGNCRNLELGYPPNVIHYSYSIEDFEKTLVDDKATNLDEKYIPEQLGKLDGFAIRRIVDAILN